MNNVLCSFFVLTQYEYIFTFSSRTDGGFISRVTHTTKISEVHNYQNTLFVTINHLLHFANSSTKNTNNQHSN